VTYNRYICGSKNTNSLSIDRHPHVHQIRTSSVTLSSISMRLVALCVCVFCVVDGEWCRFKFLCASPLCYRNMVRRWNNHNGKS